MPTDADKRNEMHLALTSVIDVLIDGQKGFAEAGDHLKDPALKRYFLAESLKRAQFRGDLEEVLHQNGFHDIKESSGTTAGALHRVWSDLKAKLGGGDQALVATAEDGEDAARDAYADILEQDLPLPVRQILAEQQAHILTSHDYLKAQKDQSGSK